MSIIDDDVKMLDEAKQYLARAEREGLGIVRLPTWLVEALIERATRPHD